MVRRRALTAASTWVGPTSPWGLGGTNPPLCGKAIPVKAQRDVTDECETRAVVGRRRKLVRVRLRRRERGRRRIGSARRGIGERAARHCLTGSRCRRRARRVGGGNFRGRPHRRRCTGPAHTGDPSIRRRRDRAEHALRRPEIAGAWTSSSLVYGHAELLPVATGTASSKRDLRQRGHRGRSKMCSSCSGSELRHRRRECTVDRIGDEPVVAARRRSCLRRRGSRRSRCGRSCCPRHRPSCWCRSLGRRLRSPRSAR